MPRHRCALLLCGTLLSWTAPSPAAIALRGVMTKGDTTLLALADEGGAAGWVALGERFAGYRLEGYDARSETARLVRGAETLRVRLEAGGAFLATSARDMGGTCSLADELSIRDNLAELAAAAAARLAESDAPSVTYDELVGPGKPVRRIRSHAGERYDTLRFTRGQVLWSVTTANGAVVTYRTDASSLPAREADNLERIGRASGVPLQRLRSLNPHLDPLSPLPAGLVVRVR